MSANAPAPIPPLGVILWPAFIATITGAVVFFAVFDPLALSQLLTPVLPTSRLSGYTLGFAGIWLTTSLSSTMTWLLLRPQSAPPAQLDEEAIDP